MSQLGRISGPLLKANLIRDGVDLAFETDLLYLDVNNSRIGIRTTSPQYDLDVNGTVRSTDLLITNQATIAAITISGNDIVSSTGIIDFTASGGDATVYHSRLVVDDYQIQGNVISTTVSNSSIELRANGTGTIEILSNTEITGNVAITGDLDVTGNITIGGNIIIGDESTDTITINARIQSDLIPELDNTYDLGTPSFRWKDIYVNNFFTTALRVPTLDIGDLEFRNNEITSTSNTDIIVNGSGTGGVRFANFRFSGNTITNTVSGAISVIAQTGIGYFKIDTTNGFVPPVGNNAQRPTAYAVLGMTRYNTVSKALEVWDGIAWASPAGAGGAVSVAAAEDIAAIYALALG